MFTILFVCLLFFSFNENEWEQSSKWTKTQQKYQTNIIKHHKAAQMSFVQQTDPLFNKKNIKLITLVSTTNCFRLYKSVQIHYLKRTTNNILNLIHMQYSQIITQYMCVSKHAVSRAGASKPAAATLNKHLTQPVKDQQKCSGECVPAGGS